jgi:hypothetical protein
MPYRTKKPHKTSKRFFSAPRPSSTSHYLHDWLFTTPSRTHPPPAQDRKTILSWSRFASCLFIGFMTLCIVRTATLQVARGDSYLAAANDNRIRDEISYAPRGRIMDRNGKILARNSLQFQLAVTPYLLPRDDADRERAYRVVAAVTKISETSSHCVAPITRPDTSSRTGASPNEGFLGRHHPDETVRC